MRTIIVYYSLEGNTKHLANEIKEVLDCEIFLLEMIKPYSTVGIYSKALRDISKKIEPKLVKIPDVSRYDRVIICSPVWFCSYVPVFNTFFNNVDLENKEVFIFTTSELDTGNVLNKLKKKSRSNNALTYDFGEIIKTKSYEKEINKIIFKGGYV